MLEDHKRTGAYYQAVMQNRRQFEGRVVLDVGTGSGILAIFAAKAGAKRVYAVEATGMAKFARQLVQANQARRMRPGSAACSTPLHACPLSHFAFMMSWRGCEERSTMQPTKQLFTASPCVGLRELCSWPNPCRGAGMPWQLLRYLQKCTHAMAPAQRS
jgi:hypothetical protein